MSVKLLDSSYLNRKYKHLGVEQEVDWRYFQPVVFTHTGIALVNSLRKVLMDEVDCFAVKTSLKLEDYEQLDQKGNSYLDEFYRNQYSIDTTQNYFQSSTDRSKYERVSGYAKVIRVDGHNQIVYDGAEHTQILTDKLGYIPINSELDYIFDVDNDQKVPLDQLWIFIGTTSEQQFDSPNIIDPIVNSEKEESEHLKPVSVSNSLVVCYCKQVEDQSKSIWYNITSQCVPKRYSKLGTVLPGDGEVDNYLFPCDTLITCLKPGQKIKAYMRLERGGGRQYAKWLPLICRSKFATEADLKGSLDLEDNVAQRQFKVTDDPLIGSVFLNEPESIILTLESISKLNVPNALHRTFTLLQHWFFDFRNHLLDLFLNENCSSSDASDQLSFSHPMLKVERFEYPELVLQLRDCNHNFISLLIDFLLRHMIELVRRDTWNKKSDKGKIVQQIKQYHSKLRNVGGEAPVLNRQDNAVKQAQLDHKSAIVQAREEILSELVSDGDGHFENKREVLFNIKDYELNELSSFEDYYIDKTKTSKTKEPTDKEKIDKLKTWLEQTVIAYRKRHPLRQEAYLTVKYPIELLEKINTSDLDEYFYDAQTKIREKNEQQLNFCKILYLMLSGLDYLDGYLERLRFEVEKTFRDTVDGTAFGDDDGTISQKLAHQYENYTYNYFLKNNQIITQYKKDTVHCLPYHSHQIHDGEAIRGQRKLMLTEVFFLSKFLTPATQKKYMVVYAGAADGSHQLILQKMFPELKFLLFDPNFSNVFKAKQLKDQFSVDDLSELLKNAKSPKMAKVKKILKDESDDEIHKIVDLAFSENIFEMGKKIFYYEKDVYDSVEKPNINLRQIKLSDAQYHVFPCYFDENVSAQMVELADRDKKEILFISDLRLVPDEASTQKEFKAKNLPERQYRSFKEAKTQIQVYEDNCKQYRIISRLNEGSGKDKHDYLRAAMIKFRFPYKECADKLEFQKKYPHHINNFQSAELKHNEFFRGEVFIQPYAPGSTTETRLIITREDLQHKDPLIFYDDVKYEEFFSYINNVVRRSMRFSVPRMTYNLHPKHKLYHKYDHLLELYILNQYVQVFYPEEIAENTVDPYDKLWDWLLMIEQHGVMANINWRDSHKGKAF